MTTTARGALSWPDLDEEEARSLRNRYKCGRPGSRRYNRWYNGFVLGQDFGEPTSVDYSPEDLAELFKCERRPVFAFEDPRDQAAWERFCAQPEEIQQQQTNLALCAHRRRLADTHRERHISASHAYARVDRRCRKHLVKYAPTALLEEMDLAVRSVLDEQDAFRLFTLPNAFHRLLLHGVCAYYGVLSSTRCEVVTVQLHPKLSLHSPTTPLLVFLERLSAQQHD